MTLPVTTAIPFFSEAELRCKSSGVIKLHPSFAAELPKLRQAWGRPLIPNSVCRSPAHNAKVGGNPRSLHMTDNAHWPTLGTMAADIGWANWSKDERLAFCRVAWGLGWSVGLHNSFCHVDRRADLNLPNLPQAIFLYGAWNNQFTREDILATI